MFCRARTPTIFKPGRFCGPGLRSSRTCGLGFSGGRLAGLKRTKDYSFFFFFPFACPFCFTRKKFSYSIYPFKSEEVEHLCLGTCPYRIRQYQYTLVMAHFGCSRLWFSFNIYSYLYAGPTNLPYVHILLLDPAWLCII